ncbi:hypothetical protein BVG16_10715 [Paenibacillus selenitireducens]|uniref:DUF5666 domain-containing protein n=1 Tax=Paenibacillus selenitireducens TaxID=1324314 RepID=A0A1T2XEP4_9BACL|nr:hypothetical protein [Paenibacillus selenitireducens]OPA78349.1 hypothetical protein BVG16_10715 [Paenibacillus selenitireducens]
MSRQGTRVIGWICTFMIVLGLTTACSSNAGNDGTSQAVGAQNEGTDTGMGRQGMMQMQNAPDQPDRQMDFMAKVVAIEGTKVTIQKANFQPGQGGERARQSQGDGNKPSNQTGNEQSASATSGDQPAPNDMKEGEGDGSEKQGQRSRGMGGGMTFEEDTSVIQIAADTPIYTMTRQDEKMAYEKIQANDLKADEMITVWLKSGTTDQAEYVVIRGEFGPREDQATGTN